MPVYRTFFYDVDLKPSGKSWSGTWKGGKTGEGTRTALVRCPDCGEIISLSKHTICDAGGVSPSVVCPMDGCAFHAFIRLKGWVRYG